MCKIDFIFIFFGTWCLIWHGSAPPGPYCTSFGPISIYTKCQNEAICNLKTTCEAISNLKGAFETKGNLWSTLESELLWNHKACWGLKACEAKPTTLKRPSPGGGFENHMYSIETWNNLKCRSHVLGHPHHLNSRCFINVSLLARGGVGFLKSPTRGLGHTCP